MAGQTVILELPEAVYRWAERTADDQAGCGISVGRCLEHHVAVLW
jgi:hypothetical protein